MRDANPCGNVEGGMSMMDGMLDVNLIELLTLAAWSTQQPASIDCSGASTIWRAR